MISKSGQLLAVFKSLGLLFLIVPLFFASKVKAQEGVILLHGLCRSSACMEKMRRALVKQNYIVLNCNYPSRTASIDSLSDKVIGAALADPQLASCRKVHFVTHSLGGILVRSYFAGHEDKRLGRVVMLGPPNQGSEVVDVLGGWKIFQMVNGPAGNELGTSANLTPNQLGSVKFELGIIAGDRSINWINSCMIQGIDDGKVSVERTKVEGMKEHLVVHSAHPFLMKNSKVIEYALKFLASGSFTSRIRKL